MNIWALDKDVRIKSVLLRLIEQLGTEGFVIKDSSAEDTHSIRLAATHASDISVYLYTYGQSEGCYGLDLEYPIIDAMNFNQTIETQENLNFESLLQLIQMHLEMVEY